MKKYFICFVLVFLMIVNMCVFGEIPKIVLDFQYAYNMQENAPIVDLDLGDNLGISVLSDRDFTPLAGSVVEVNVLSDGQAQTMTGIVMDEATRANNYPMLLPFPEVLAIEISNGELLSVKNTNVEIVSVYLPSDDEIYPILMNFPNVFFVNKYEEPVLDYNVTSLSSHYYQSINPDEIDLDANMDLGILLKNDLVNADVVGKDVNVGVFVDGQDKVISGLILSEQVFISNHDTDTRGAVLLEISNSELSRVKNGRVTFKYFTIIEGTTDGKDIRCDVADDTDNSSFYVVDEAHVTSAVNLNPKEVYTSNDHLSFELTFDKAVTFSDVNVDVNLECDGEMHVASGIITPLTDTSCRLDITYDGLDLYAPYSVNLNSLSGQYEPSRTTTVQPFLSTCNVNIDNTRPEFINLDPNYLHDLIMVMHFDDESIYYGDSFDAQMENYHVYLAVSEEPITGDISYQELSSNLNWGSTPDGDGYRNWVDVTLDMDDQVLKDVKGTDKPFHYYFKIVDPIGNMGYGHAYVRYDDGGPNIEMNDYLDEKRNQLIDFSVDDTKLHTVGFVIENSKFKLTYYNDFVNPDWRDHIYDNAVTLSTDTLSLYEGVLDLSKMQTVLADEVIQKGTESSDGYLKLETDKYLITLNAFDGMDHSDSKTITTYIDITDPFLTVQEDGEKGHILSVFDENGYDPYNRDVNIKFEVIDEQEQIVYAKDDIKIPIITPSSISFPYGDLSPGQYSVRFTASDLAGNQMIVIPEEMMTVLAPHSILASGNFHTNGRPLDVTLTTDAKDGLEYRVLFKGDVVLDWNQLLTDTKEIDLTLDFTGLDQGVHKFELQSRYPGNGGYVTSELVAYNLVYDTQAPSGLVTYSTNVNVTSPVIATLVDIVDNYTDEVIVEIAKGEQVTPDTKTKIILFSNDERAEFVLRDLAGNEARLSAQTDKILSDVKAEWSSLDPTNQFVSVHLEFINSNEPVTPVRLFKDDVELTGNVVNEVTFFDLSENGIYKFVYGDENKVKLINLSWIDKEVPSVENFTYSTVEMTCEPVLLRVNLSEVVNYGVYSGDTLKASGQSSLVEYSFNQNDVVELRVEDLAGNTNTFTYEVKNIDKEELILDYTENKIYSRAGKLKGIEYIFTANKPFRFYGGHPDLANTHKVYYEEDGDYTITAYDESRNKDTVTLTVSGLDYGRATADLDYSTLKLTREDVIVTVIGEVEVLNNDGDPVMICTRNGDYSFALVDAWGNIFEKNFTINNIDKLPPEISFTPYDSLVVNYGADFFLEEGVHIYDEHDGIINDFIIDGGFSSKEPGEYFVFYGFKDLAGNQGFYNRKVTVLDSSLNVAINGQLNFETLSSKDLQIDVYNPEGDDEIQMDYGLHGTGHFKSKKYLCEDKLSLEKGGYVTVYVIDKERNSKLLTFYVFD
ncbi:hypothetical protein EZV73_22260 [Acidaminobacter sp. JC074]|uniref:hypothetical protein n=1 Tax=Acidaminobacter sp. JC074 TaxID=2530199 RepID=UPI001F0E02CA|nr:hypothetical protein [Acidaminobacter sp. JC074]MCH4890323.1 hypothetical protein [Acidaminobacter sp. JC074]